MLAEWLQDPASKPPEPPEGSEIAATLSALQVDPTDTDQLPTIDAALESDDPGKQHAAIECLELLARHAPMAVKQRRKDVSRIIQSSEHRSLVIAFMEMDATLVKALDEPLDDPSDHKALIDPEQPVQIRRPAMETLEYSVRENPVGFMYVDDAVAAGIVDAYPGVQAPAIRTLRHALHSNTGHEGEDYVGHLDEALATEDTEVRTAALTTLSDIGFEHPGAIRQAGDRIVELLSAEDQSVQQEALRAAYALSMTDQDCLVSVLDDLSAIAAGWVDIDEENTLEPPAEEIAEITIADVAAYPGASDRIDPTAVLDMVHSEGSEVAWSGAYLVFHVADTDPDAVSDAAPILADKLETDLAGRDEALDDVALALGSLSTVREDPVRSVAEALVDGLADPSIEDYVVIRELAFLAMEAPTIVAETLGVHGDEEWPDDGLGDSLFASMCRGMLSGVTPGYVDGGDSRTKEMVRRLAEAVDSDADDGNLSGYTLLRIAREQPSLVQPHVELLRAGLDHDAPPIRVEFVELFAELEDREALRYAQSLPCAATEAVAEAALEEIR